MSQKARIPIDLGTTSIAASQSAQVVGSGTYGALPNADLIVLSTTAASTSTLALAPVGKRITIVAGAISGTMVLTPAVLLSHNTVSFTATANSIVLVSLGTSWAIVSNNGCTIA